MRNNSIYRISFYPPYLQISPKTVDYRIQQALKQLRITLKDYLPQIMLLFPKNILS